MIICIKEYNRRKERVFIFVEVVAVELEVEGDQPSLVGVLHEGEVAFPLEGVAFLGVGPCVVVVVEVASFLGEASYLYK